MNPDEPQFEKYWRQRIHDELMTYHAKIKQENRFLEGVAFGVDIAAGIAFEGSVNYEG